MASAQQSPRERLEEQLGVPGGSAATAAPGQSGAGRPRSPYPEVPLGPPVTFTSSCLRNQGPDASFRPQCRAPGLERMYS